MKETSYTLFSTPLCGVSPKGKPYSANFAVLAINTTTGQWKLAANGFAPDFWLERYKAFDPTGFDQANHETFQGKVIVEQVDEVFANSWWHDYLACNPVESEKLSTGIER